MWCVEGGWDWHSGLSIRAITAGWAPAQHHTGLKGAGTASELCRLCSKAARRERNSGHNKELTDWKKKKTWGKKNPVHVRCKEMYGWQVFLVPLPGIRITSETAYKGKFLESESSWPDWEEKEKSRYYKVNKIETQAYHLPSVVTHFFPKK